MQGPLVVSRDWNHSVKFKPTFSIQPITILIITGLLLSLFSIFALIEFTQSRQAILRMMEDEGLVLLDALMAGAERSILAYEALENQMQDRILNTAYGIEALDYQSERGPLDLGSMAQRIGVSRIDLYDPQGRLEITSQTGRSSSEDTDIRTGDWIPPLQAGKDSVIIGLKGTITRDSRYFVAVRRRKGGAVVVSSEAENLLNLRREVGPGRFLQEIAGRPGVRDMVLQDTLGIRMASRGVRQMNSIRQDPFLMNLFRTEGQDSRIHVFEGSQGFEIVASFSVEGQQWGLFRIALSMTAYQNLLRSARIRLGLIAVSLIFLGIVGLGLVMTTQNVKVLQNAYLQVQTHTGEILQNLKDAVVAVNSGGKLTVFNKAAETIYETAQASVIGKSIPDLDLPLETLKETLKTGHEIKALEDRCTIKNKLKILRLNTSVVREAGNIDVVILVATEITREWHLEKQIRRQEKLEAMAALASGVAHEVRNPINAIGMIAQRFRKEFTPVSDKAEFMALAEVMNQEVKRIDRIIEQFLKFSRPPELRLKPLKISRLLRNIKIVFQSMAEAQNIEFQLEVRDDAVLNLDQDQLKQAILNLLKNSLEACRVKDRIRLLGTIEDKMYGLIVEDTGRGIPEAEFHRIFDLYYTTKPEGTGIGLPMAAQIIQGHGGSIEVKSRPEKGTVFRIELPLAKTEK
jgi:two-component system sensor histidine kinase HydH